MQGKSVDSGLFLCSFDIRKETHTGSDLRTVFKYHYLWQTRVTKAGGCKCRAKKGPYTMSHAMLLLPNLHKYVMHISLPKIEFK